MSGARVEYADDARTLGMLADLLRQYVVEQGWDSEPHHLEEIAMLPGEYAPPAGRALVVLDASGEAVGCVVLRPVDAWCDDCVEMRRLYVVPEARQRGIGRALVQVSEEWAREAGYRRLRLVTLPNMVEAIELYSTLGFEIVEPYRPSTAEDAIFMDKPLQRT